MEFKQIFTFKHIINNMKNMKKTILVLSAGIIAAFAVLFATADTAHAANCKNNICATLISAGGGGQAATARVANNSGSSTQIAFYTYKVFIQPYNEGWGNQELYDHKVITLADGQTQTVSVNTPDCMAQFDVHIGYPEQTEASILIGLFSSDKNLCQLPLTISGKVTKCGQPVSNVAINTCHLGTVYTDASGNWSAAAYSGASYCARASNSAKAANNVSCFTDNASYEWQVAGQNKFTGCGSSEINAWDRSSDSNIDFVIDCPCTDECSTNDQKVCAGDGWKKCGNYDSDSCLEWSDVTNCAANQVCDEGECFDCGSGLTGTITYAGSAASPATATVSNQSKCTHEVSFCAYNLYIKTPLPGWLDTQVLYNSKKISIGPGQTKPMSLDVNGCMTQVDLFKGECVYPLGDNMTYPTLLAGVINAEELCKKCEDDCVAGAKRCANGAVETCGNYDSDSCTEWGNAEDCGDDQWTDNYRCSADWTQRERIKRGCSYDQCFETKEWVNQTDCDALNKKCDGGQCVIKCTNECSSTGAKKCTGNDTYQVCGNYDSDDCLEWGDNKNCATGSTCKGDGICEHVVKPVSVDLKGPESISCQENFTLTWTSANATSCAASGAWSGTKAVNGSQAIATIASAKTYTLTCTGEDGSDTDSVTVTVSGDVPAANAGDDKDTFESTSITLDGSATGSNLTYAWTCNGGTVTNASSANATFKAPSVSTDTYYVCTLKVTNKCGSDTDTLNILVKNKTETGLTVNLTATPKTGCVTLKNVDLTAEAALVGGDSNDQITYYFDCDNNGSYEKTVTTANRGYTAADLCQYATKGTHTAAVKVSALGLTDTATATITTRRCGGGGSDDPDVALDAHPDNGCAPLKNVDLYAEVYPNGHGDDDYTYYFYCDEDSDDDDYDKKVTTSKTSYTAEELCDYSDSDTYTARVRVESGNDLDVEDTADIEAEDCGKDEGNLSIEKLVSNLSNGTGYLDSVAAKPGDVLSFKITVEAVNGDLQDVQLTDVLPYGIRNAQDIYVDGSRVSDNLASGIDLGDIDESDTVKVIFTAYVADKDSFSFGQNRVTNTAEAECDDDNCSDEDSAEVTVNKTQVEGATTVSTGFTNNPFIDSFVIPAGLALFLIWAFKAKLIKAEEWLDGKRKNYFVYKSAKTLDLQRAKLKAKQIVNRFN